VRNVDDGVLETVTVKDLAARAAATAPDWPHGRWTPSTVTLLIAAVVLHSRSADRFALFLTN
jgi:hypothetical protein